MEGEGFGWPIPGADNDNGLIHYFQGAARTPPDAADADITAISRQAVINFYATIHQSYSSQSNDLRRLADRVLSLEAQLVDITITRDNTLTELESWHGRFNTMMQMTARLGVGGANGGGGGAFSKSHLKQHQPPLFTGGAAMGTMESDKRIDSAWRFMDPEVYSWFAHWIHQQGVTVIPPANGSYAPVTWPLFKSAFRHRFVPEVAITAVRKEIRALRYSKGAGDVAYFNKRFSELIRMLQKETTITCVDPLYDEYCAKLPSGIADQIIASARMQKKLQPGTPFTLADAMEMVAEFSEHTTSDPATPATPVHHGDSFAPPNAATVPTPAGPEPMDLTVANPNTRCYRCNGFGYEARNCMTPDTRGRGQAFRVRNGGNRGRRDGGHDRNDIRRGGPGASARSAAGSINNVQEAAGDDASVNDDGEDLAVEQEVLDEEDGQGNGNWE
ncbi:hypothetical protein K440DRAFT_669837 [Wilcoxina mikolae CBS 423.85]|nr:hypothetical protein K440DRAFT_669837 [Wilcoxina mikolae CBS 423.85]